MEFPPFSLGNVIAVLRRKASDQGLSSKSQDEKQTPHMISAEISKNLVIRFTIMQMLEHVQGKSVKTQI